MHNESTYEPKTMLENNHERILETFKEAVTSNSSLKSEEDSIIEVFDNMLYNAMLHNIPIPFDKIIERIEMINFVLGNRYVLKDAYQYDVSKNKIELKQSEIENNNPYYFTMILYDMALRPEEKDASYFEALYKGEICDLALSTLGLEEVPESSFDEVMLYRSLKAILGEEVIANGLLTSNCALIYQAMQDFGFTKEDIQMICKTSNYNQYGRYPTGCSTLLDTEMKIIDVFVENVQKDEFMNQKMHFLKKVLDTSCRELKNNNLKYGIKNLDTLKQVLGENDYTNESMFPILTKYFEQKINSNGLNEINYGISKL